MIPEFVLRREKSFCKNFAIFFDVFAKIRRTYSILHIVRTPWHVRDIESYALSKFQPPTTLGDPQNVEKTIRTKFHEEADFDIKTCLAPPTSTTNDKKLISDTKTHNFLRIVFSTFWGSPSVVGLAKRAMASERCAKSKFFDELLRKFSRSLRPSSSCIY